MTDLIQPAKLTEVMKFFNIKGAKNFQTEWNELTEEDKYEIRLDLAVHLKNEMAKKKKK